MTSSLAKHISQITRSEPRLLYYSPRDIQKNINNNRILTFDKKGKLAGFVFWHQFNNWAEISAIYIKPEFRNKGYSRKIFEDLYEKMKDKNNKIVIFTSSPKIIGLLKKNNFKRVSFLSLPFDIVIRIILHRTNPKRWLSYLELLKTPARPFKTRIFTMRTSFKNNV